VTRLLRYSEAADLLGISRSALGRAIASGQLQPIQAPGTTGRRGRRISSAQVEALMALPAPEPVRSPSRTSALSRGGPLQRGPRILATLKRLKEA
jgi:excisionase family DNA binding protein